MGSPPRSNAPRRLDSLGGKSGNGSSGRMLSARQLPEPPPVGAFPRPPLLTCACTPATSLAGVCVSMSDRSGTCKQRPTVKTFSVVGCKNSSGAIEILKHAVCTEHAPAETHKLCVLAAVFDAPIHIPNNPSRASSRLDWQLFFSFRWTRHRTIYFFRVSRCSTQDRMRATPG